MPPDEASLTNTTGSHHRRRIARILGALLLTVSFAAQGLEVVPGTSVRDVLQAAGDEGLRLIYNDRIVPADLRVTARAQATGTLARVREVLAAHGLSLEPIAEATYAVVATHDAAEPATTTGSLIGQVLDDATSQPMHGARITIVENGAATRTGREGGYSFTGLAPGLYTLRIVSRDGLRRTVATPIVEAGRPTVVHSQLAAGTLALEQVVVTTSRYGLLYDSPDGHTVLGQSQVENLPRMGEETLRSVQRLPGSASNGVSAVSYIRGGAQDEMLVLLDGLELVEPFHLKNFLAPFSAVDSHIVGTMDYYTGGFPAQFGNRMSAVLDMQTIDPPSDRYAEIGVSPYYTSLIGAGTFRDGAGDWLISGRRGNLDVVARTAGSDIGVPEYFDATAKLAYAFDNGTTAQVNYLRSQDEIALNNSADTSQSTARYRNDHTWASVSHPFTSQLSARLMLAHTNVLNRRGGSIDEPGVRTGSVRDVREFRINELSLDALWHSASLLLRGGVRGRHLESGYEYDSNIAWQPDIAADSLTLVDRTRSIRTAPEGDSYGAYLSARQRLGDRLTAEVGLRWDKQTYTDDPGGSFVSPRVNLLWDAFRHTRLRASWGRYVQPQSVYRLQVEDGETRFNPAQRAEHFVLGLDHGFAGGIDLRLEGYYKDISQPQQRFENVFDSVVLLPELQPDRARIAPQGAYARGVELLLSGTAGANWRWRFNAAWSEVKDEIGAEDVFRSWDQEGTVNAIVSRQGPMWDIDVSATYHSGWPTTALDAVSIDGSGTVNGERNTDRYGAFRTVDVRATRRFPTVPGELSGYVELINMFAEANACCVEIEFKGNPPTLTTNREYWPGVVPGIGFYWRF